MKPTITHFHVMAIYELPAPCVYFILFGSTLSSLNAFLYFSGISSNHSDDQPYSWSTLPFHPSTMRYKNAPVCGAQADSVDVVCPVKV